MVALENKDAWWRKAQFYQIWPKSFCDSNGDGYGDLRGIISKVAYLKELGIDAIWCTPCFDSPGKDNGYDIRDYRKIDPRMGTMEDFEELIKVVHEHGMKLIIDMVFNHCSEEHVWFQKSCQRDPEYDDYFIWRDGVGPDKKGLPNNWGSIFQGPTWTWNENRQQYYFHLFAKCQPDLNWDNPKVREEVQSIIKFWNAKGVDGYRLDALSHLSKKEGLPSYPTIETDVKGDWIANGPRMHEYIKFVCSTIKEGNPDRVIFAETAYVPNEEFHKISEPSNKELDFVILFNHTSTDFIYDSIKGKFNYKGLDLTRLKEEYKTYYKHLHGGWLNLFICNHDQPRIVSRWGDEGEHLAASAKMFGMFNNFMLGTPFIYQGEELGMTNWRFSKEQADDIEFHMAYKDLVEDRKLLTHDEFMATCHIIARDCARTPVHWDDSPNAGFTKPDVTPWLPVVDNYKTINAATEAKQPDSVLNFYKQIVAIRKQTEGLLFGKLTVREEFANPLFVYTREFEKEGKTQTFALVTNFSKDTHTVDLSGLAGNKPVKVVLSNYPGQELPADLVVTILPFHGLLVEF